MKCVASHEITEKSVLAEVATGKFIPSYKDIKEVLTGIFGLNIRDFAGVARTTDKNKPLLLKKRLS